MSRDGDRTPPRYFAFLSYRSSDRRLAEWLFKRLERYRLPKSLVGKRIAGRTVPRRLGRIFLDREEARSAEDVETIIAQELSKSEHLIVLCTPSAARAEAWVGREIELFRERRPSAAIHAIIGSGNPPECFPPQLLSRDAAGRTMQPLAADLRSAGDGREKGLLKLVAGLLGLNFDDLYRRELRRRVRNYAVFASIAVFVAAGAALVTQYSLSVEQRRNWQDAWGEADNDYQRLRLALSAQDEGFGISAPPDPRAVAYLAELRVAPAVILKPDFQPSMPAVLLGESHIAWPRSGGVDIFDTATATMKSVDLSCASLNLSDDCLLTPFFRVREDKTAFAIASASNAGSAGILLELSESGVVTNHGPAPCSVAENAVSFANLAPKQTGGSPIDNFCLHALSRSLAEPHGLSERKALAASISLEPTPGAIGAWSALSSDHLLLSGRLVGEPSIAVFDLRTGERREIGLSPCMIDTGSDLKTRPCTVGSVLVSEAADRLVAVSEPLGYLWELDGDLKEITARPFDTSGDNYYMGANAPGERLTFLAQNNGTSVFGAESRARISVLPAGCMRPVSDELVVCSIAGSLSIWRVGTPCPACDYQTLRKATCGAIANASAQKGGTTGAIDTSTMEGIARACQ